MLFLLIIAIIIVIIVLSIITIIIACLFKQYQKPLNSVTLQATRDPPSYTGERKPRPAACAKLRRPQALAVSASKA